MSAAREAPDPAARERVKARALRLLARREHGVKELGGKLLKKADTDPDDVRAVVQELVDEGLLSDARYAEAVARDAVRLKPRARRHLVGELVGRGVPASLAGRSVDAAFADEQVDDDVLARRLAESYLPRIADRPADARWRRLAGFLQRRGFDNERIYAVCSALLPGIDAEAE